MDRPVLIPPRFLQGEKIHLIGNRFSCACYFYLKLVPGTIGNIIGTEDNTAFGSVIIVFHIKIPIFPEPLMQVDFLIDLFTIAKQHNVHTCIDSSGIAFKPDNKPFIEKLDRLMKLTDLVMLDIKHIDPDRHKELTAQPNDGILAFASYLNDRHVDMWIRHVVVPGITDDEEYLYKLGYFIGQFSNLKALDVLPYHTMGESKYKKLGIPYKLAGVPAMEKSKIPEKKEAILNGIRRRREEKSM